MVVIQPFPILYYAFAVGALVVIWHERKNIARWVRKLPRRS